MQEGNCWRYSNHSSCPTKGESPGAVAKSRRERRGEGTREGEGMKRDRERERREGRCVHMLERDRAGELVYMDRTASLYELAKRRYVWQLM